MLLETLQTARDLGRLRQIAVVLIRHGLGDALRRLGVARAIERAGGALHWKGAVGLADKEPEVRVREAFEQLGPTFVKLGQILAGRSDLLPPHWTAELARLHERAGAAAFDSIHAQLTEDLGTTPEEVFRDFDPLPLAAASIAQVHAATLEDGTHVVLKVRRPGIRETVDGDVRLLLRLAERAEERMPELKRFRPRRLVRQFARSMGAELDLRVEAKNAGRLRATLEGLDGIVVPRVHGEWTCERLLVMDRLEGPSLGDWIREQDPGAPEGKRIAAAGADIVLRMVLVNGFFHADPHPGNVIRLPGGDLGLIDFGMVGTLSEARRIEFLDLLFAIVSRRVERAVDILLGWSDDPDVDIDLLTQECTTFIDRYDGVPLKHIDTAELLGDLTTLLRDNDIVLPADVASLLKVFVTLEGLGRLLDPEFVMASHVEPFATEAWQEHHSPGRVVRRGARELGQLFTGLPRDLRDLLRTARRGRIRVDVDLERLDRFGSRIVQSSNRLTVGLITAALIVGTSITLTVPGGPRTLGMPLFGLLGFSSSLVVGVWLLGSILRSGRS